jgi:hypothetical protein
MVNRTEAVIDLEIVTGIMVASVAHRVLLHVPIVESNAD